MLSFLPKKIICSTAFYFGLISLGYSQNVGIGVTAPAEKLDINGDVVVRGQNLYVSHDNVTNANNDYMSYNDASPTTLGGTGIFHFHSDEARAGLWNTPTASVSARGAYFSGRLGVGTSNPLNLAHFSGGIGDAVLRIEADTDNAGEGDNPSIEMYQDGGLVGIYMGFYEGTINSGNTFRIGTRYTGVDDLATFTINTETKDIGIGTVEPDERLDIVGGGIQLNGLFGIGFAGDIPENGNVSGDRAKMYYDNNYDGTNYDFLVLEKTDGNNVDPDGGFSFTMKGSDNVREPAFTIRGTSRVGVGTVINPAYALELPNSTVVGVGRGRANAWVTYSDGRLKDNRKALAYGLNTIMKIKPLEYQHHNSINDIDGNLKISGDSKKDIGFIAQDLQKIIPEIVYEPENTEKDLWSVDYMRLIPVLTKAIQEQQASIEKLEKRCLLLEEKLKISEDQK